MRVARTLKRHLLGPSLLALLSCPDCAVHAQPASGNPMQMPIPKDCMPDLGAILRDDIFNGLAGCLASQMPGGANLPPEIRPIISPIENAGQVAMRIFSFYNLGRPIGITHVSVQFGKKPGGPTGGTSMCLLLLSGTEPNIFSQATTLPEDLRAAINNAADDDFHQAILRALNNAVVIRHICKEADRVMIAGHSLGGMEAQNVAVDLVRAGQPMLVTNIITYGSPLTAEIPGSLSIRRFSTIGDPIPYTTIFTRSYRPVEQTIVDDRTGQARAQALLSADATRDLALSAIQVSLAENAFTMMSIPLVANWMWGATTFHMSYPTTRELRLYDPFGNRIGHGATGQLVVDYRDGGTPSIVMYTAPRHYVVP